MRIGVFFNCQFQGLANALKVLLPGSEVIACARCTVRETRIDQTVSVLRSCDAVICSSEGANSSPLSNDRLRAAGCNIVVVPPVVFSGFHPDTICRVHGLDGATANDHSRLNLIGFLAGLSVADTVDLFNGMVFRRLGYFEYDRVGRTFLATCFASAGIDIVPYLDRWRKAGVFMHTPVHPKVMVTCDLAEIACHLAGLRINGSRHAFDLVPDSLSRYPRHPVFPEIARELGVEGHTLFMPESLTDGVGFRVLTLPEFTAEQFTLYPSFDRATLLAADGVRSGLEALGLQERPRSASADDASAAEFNMTPAAGFNADITPGDDSISLSGSWHPFEYWAGDTFRWVSHSATITLLAVKDGIERLDLDLEPGPGAAELPLQFDVVDKAGGRLLTTSLHGRQTVTVDVPVQANQKSRLRILARNGGRAIPGDPRILDFRVFRIDRQRREMEHAETMSG
jgi:Polysaccharide biosynthesis enzyme WcbI